MDSKATTLAALTLLALLVIGTALLASRAPRAGYLVAPALDLTSPGERGTYYALATCPPAAVCHHLGPALPRGPF